MSDTITSWSYSRLLDYEKCPLSAKLKFIDKLPQESGPAAERGTAIHQLAEDYVSGKIKKLPSELNKFVHEFAAIKAQYEQGIVSLEGDWGFTEDWEPCGFKEAWLRMKLDARVRLSKTQSVVIDYKTGKRYNNELKHGEQTVLYGIAEVLREPDVQEVFVELWYLDLGELKSTKYTREELLRYLPPFEKRGKSVTRATRFPANPSVNACKWCSFGPDKGAQCEYGVRAGDTPISIYRRKFD